MKQNKKSSTSEPGNSSHLLSAEYTAILDSIPDVIVRCDQQGNIFWWNKNFQDIVALDQDIKNKSIFQFINDGENNELDSFLPKIIELKNAEIDVFLNSSEGKKLYHFKATLVEDESLDRGEILLVGRDIDERSRMSVILKRSQSQLQILIDTLPYLIFVVSPENRFIVVNKKYADFSGRSFDKIIGNAITDIHNKEVSVFLTRDNNLIIEKKEPVQYEGLMEVNGISRHYSVNKMPLFDENGNIYAFCGIAEDITSQYQLQRKLQQAQKMEAIGQLTGGIAHDFNNILASIMGYTNLIRRRVEDQNDDKLNEYLTKVQRSGERARDTVKQLLAFSRGEVEGVQLVDPVIMTKDAIDMLSSLIPSSIQLSFNIPAPDKKQFIEVDPVQFHQGIMNLVINARDAIVDKIGEIEVSIEYAKQVRGFCDSCHSAYSGQYVLISVKDTGQGISQEIMSRIFDPFFTTKPVGKGSGMGLSMLHGIVHGSGGHISIHTSSATGTRVNLLFPQVSSANTVEENSATYKDTQENESVEMIKKSILVVDDEELITIYLSDLLSIEGYNVIAFNNPAEAYDYYRENAESISLVITDQTMPGLTGLELAKKLQLLNHDTPVVLCSGYTDLADQTIDTDTGVDVFLDKPFDDKKLMSTIAKFLES